MAEVLSHQKESVGATEHMESTSFSSRLRTYAVWALTGVVGLAGCASGPKKRDADEEVLARLVSATKKEMRLSESVELSAEDQRIRNAIEDLRSDLRVQEDRSGKSGQTPESSLFDFQLSGGVELGGYLASPDDSVFNARLFHNLEANVGAFEGLASFLHQYRGGIEDPYYGRYVFGVGHEDLPFKGITVLDNNHGEIEKPQYGIRLQAMPEKLFGWVDITANDEDSKLTMLVGREFPELVDGLSMNFVYIRDKLFQDEKSSDYFEFQVNQRVGELFGESTNSSLLGAMEDGSIYLRVEVPDWNDARFVVGYSYSF